MSWGPSPRVRGSHDRNVCRIGREGAIPACAGKPRQGSSLLSVGRVHPRVCGEASGIEAAPKSWPGPSPRVRGSLETSRAAARIVRSIPACAGKPSPLPPVVDLRRVHPRVCGEAAPENHLVACAWGPSPRVRGSLVSTDAGRSAARSIPACAGKPTVLGSNAPLGRVHPRVCGEAVHARWRLDGLKGPSPRVRGSPIVVAGVGRKMGSIPACAGKPYLVLLVNPEPRVHPRVCGEACTSARPTSLRPGPSPRVRGSHARVAYPHLHDGSIPACAGKPERVTGDVWFERVHPRVCGEAPPRECSVTR